MHALLESDAGSAVRDLLQLLKCNIIALTHTLVLACPQQLNAQKESASKAKAAAQSGAVEELRAYFGQPLELFSQAAEYVHMHTGTRTQTPADRTSQLPRPTMQPVMRTESLPCPVRCVCVH